MKIQQFQKQFSSFISSNADLVSKYELECNDCFEDNLNDIYTLYNRIIASNNGLTSNLKSILHRALDNAISCQMSITDSLTSMLDLTNTCDFDSTTLSKYFSEVNDIYVKNNNDYDIVYCPENREKLIEMNLKAVISVAKKYQGLGIDLDDLIQAGNEGLCVSFTKYDPSRAKLRDKVLECAEQLPDEVTVEELTNAFSEYLSYGDIAKKFKKEFTALKYSKQHIIQWVKKNIVNAKFNSVATMWIRAYIFLELNNNSRTVRKPKAEITKDVLETGAYKKEVKVDIDAPIGDGESRTFGETLCMEDDRKSDLEVRESQILFKTGLNKLLTGVKPRDRAVFLKKFGIGLPRPMLPREIAEQEGLSIARVSQIFQVVEQQIQKNQVKYNIDVNELMSAAKDLR